MRRLHLPAVLALLVFVGIALPVGAAEVDLALADEFRLGNATLALGHLDLGQPELSDVHAVDVQRILVPDGTLYVCSFEGGQRDEVPPLPTLQDRCRGEDVYEDPQLTVGDRTWLVLAGNLTLADHAAASTTAIVPDGETGTIRLASITAGSIEAQVDEQMAFRPQSSASEIRVETTDDERTYNGTDWVFYMEASGTASWNASGTHAVVPGSTELSLRPAGTAAMRQALDARTLLDLQAAAVGPEQREPMANATALVGDRTRLPPLVDGSLLGYLNGTIGQRTFTPEEVSLVGVDRFDGSVDEGNLTGEADVRFTNTEAGIAPGLEAPSGVPWLAGIVLWVAAGLSMGLGPAPVVTDLRHRTLAAGVFAVALAIWDGVFASAFGASALSTSVGEAGLGVVLALAAFEVIAFGVAWLWLALPVVLTGHRWLVDKVAVYVAPIATVVLLLVAWWRPGTIVALGRLVARV